MFQRGLKKAHEDKKATYLELGEERGRHGWRAHCEPIEVGCRGFAGQSLHQTLSLLGIRGLKERRATKNIIKAEEKASRWLWIKSGYSGYTDPQFSFILGRLGCPGEGV